MANILDKYGIKEVADVTMYEINDDGSRGKPVLFLDTLKVSTIEQTAEQVSARGGKGNPELIVWDYGKEITLTLEDALFSPESMNIIYGGQEGGRNVDLISTNNLDRMEKINVTEVDATDPNDKSKYYSVDDMSEIAKADLTTYINGDTTTGKAAHKLIYRLKNYKVEGHVIEVTAANFPGTYCLVGETYARSEKTGKDEYFQFEVPKAKMGAENTLTLEAEGDPTVFNMTMKVLRPEDGVMIRLTQFTVDEVTVNFRYLDATNASTLPASKKVLRGETITLPVPTRTGYHISGWAYTQSGTAAITGDTWKVTTAGIDDSKNNSVSITLWVQWEAD